MRRWLLLVALNFAAWIVHFCLGFGDGRFRPGPELYLVRSIAISLGLPLVPVLPILGPDRLPDEVLLVVCLILNPPLWATLVHLLLWRFVDPPRNPEVPDPLTDASGEGFRQ